jgi:hypothetical protein
MRREQEAREARIRDTQSRIDTAFGGFNDAFFKDRGQAYENYAMPQLAEQYQTQKKNLVYELARRGLLRASAADTMGQELEMAKQRGQRQIADEALNQENQLRQKVQSNKQQLYAQAQSGLDPSLAVSEAMRVASTVSAPSGFAPVGQFFTDFTNAYLMNRISNMYRPEQDAGPSYNTNRGSSRIVS